MKRTRLDERTLPDYTHGEELWNMISHIIGAAIGVATTALCAVAAAMRHNVYGIVGGAIFGSTMILLYTISAIYHGLNPRLRAKKVMQVIDHCTIFVLIAGTYTPISLCLIREYDTALGWVIFSVIWAAAIVGITLNAIDLRRYRVFSMICYLGMGWCIVGTLGKLFEMFTPLGLWLLFGGGAAYTVGAVLYGLGKKKRYMHTAFHWFVVAGSICHALFIILCVL